MKQRFYGVGLALLIVLTPAVAGATATSSARLLVPLFEVDTTRGDGTTTLFAVRNERDAPADIEISYYRTNAPQAPQIPTQELTLAPKQIQTVNLRFVPTLATDEEGIARGYVVITATSENAAIQGDYFRVTPGEDFASGFRMGNIDPQSADNDLCNLFTMRFLNGGGWPSRSLFRTGRTGIARPLVAVFWLVVLLLAYWFLLHQSGLAPARASLGG